MFLAIPGGILEYIAISYVWGDPIGTREITVNNETLNVTVNLELALRHIRLNWDNITKASFFPNRLDSGYGPLWVDAICIDQSNIDERSQQVEMMREIYSGAHLVLSWLGTSTPQLSLAVSTLRLIEANVDASSDDPDWSWAKQYPQVWERVGQKPNELWTAIQALFSLPYWTRIWIIQEIVLSSRALFLIGNELLQFETYKSFINSLRVFSKPGTANTTESWFDDLLHNGILATFPTMTIAILPPLNTGFKIGQLLPLPRLLARFKEGYAASDPRDLIFAVLGISKFGIKPDYTKTVLEIYTLVALNWVNIKFEPCLDFLLCSGYGQNTRDTSWPSWVPDWRAMQNRDFLTCPWIVLRGDVQHSADLGLPAESPKLEVSPILCVAGVLTDFVVSLEDPVDKVVTIEDAFTYALRFIVNSTRPTGPSEPCLTGLLGCLTWDSVFENENEKRNFSTTFLYAMRDFIVENDVQDIPPWLQETLGKLKPTKDWTSTAIRRLIKKEPFLQRICHTAGGRIAAVSPKAGIQDYIAVIPGCSCPVLLRKVRDHFIHLGPCFVDGLMNGEVAEMLEAGKVKMEDIEIR